MNQPKCANGTVRKGYKKARYKRQASRMIRQFARTFMSDELHEVAKIFRRCKAKDGEPE